MFHDNESLHFDNRLKRRFLVKSGSGYASVKTVQVYYFVSENILTYLVLEEVKNM